MKKVFMQHARELTVFATVILILSVSGKAQRCRLCDKCLPNAIAKDIREKYQNAYDENFRKNSPYSKAQLLHRNYILFIDSFFKRDLRRDYAGVWMVFGSVDRQIGIPNGHRFDHKQITIQFVAARQDRSADYLAFKNFDSLIRKPWFFENVLISDTNRSNHFVTTLDYQFVLFATDSAIKSHSSKFRINFKDSPYVHTKAVFLCKETFSEMALELQSDSSLRAKFSMGMYDQNICCTEQKFHNQISLMASIAKQNGSDIESLATRVLRKWGNATHTHAGKKKKYTADDFNHGELCPNSCPEGVGGPFPLKQ